MARIYTKSGDQGETSLFGGTRVSKDDLRVEAYGAVDELNSFLGFAKANLNEHQDLCEILTAVQHHLFDLGAELATPGQVRPEQVPRISAERVAWLEETIDRFDAALPPLKLFILPEGEGAIAHIARTIARRAERRIVTLHRREPLNPEVLRYINRLSDLLFVLARVVNHRRGEKEEIWKRRRGRPQSAPQP